MNNFFQNAFFSKVFEIMTFDFYLEEKRQLKTTVYIECKQWMNEKMKESTYPSPNIGRYC